MDRGAAPGKWTVFALVAVAVFMSTLDGSIVNIALPVIMEDYGVSLSAVKWVMMVYLLSVSSLLLSFGRLSDIRGRRWVYFRGFLLFSAGSLLCGLATGLRWLVAARVVQGAGAAMLMACSPALVVDTFPEKERGKALGAVGTVVAAGLTTGPALGGLILHYFDWTMIFFVNIPIGLASAAMAQRILKGGAGDRGRREPFDLFGGAALAVGLSALILTFSKGAEWGPLSPRTLATAALAVAGLVSLGLRSLRAEHPVFRLDLLKTRLFAVPALGTMLLFICLFSMMFLMPFYLMHPAGYSVATAGTVMTIPFVVLFFVAPAAGWLYDRVGVSRGLCTAGMTVLALSLFALSRLPAQASIADISWRLAFAGLGTALFTPPNNSTTIGAVAPRFRGIASATTATARNLGMVGGVALAGLVFNHVYTGLSGGEAFAVFRPESTPVFMAAFRHALGAASAAALAGAVLAFSRGTERARKDGTDT